MGFHLCAQCSGRPHKVQPEGVCNTLPSSSPVADQLRVCTPIGFEFSSAWIGDLMQIEAVIHRAPVDGGAVAWRLVLGAWGAFRSWTSRVLGLCDLLSDCISAEQVSYLLWMPFYGFLN